VLSATAEYALRAVVHLARQGDAEALQAQDLAEATGVPQSYLRKLLHELARAGILASTRGKGGGFTLAVPPERLTLLTIVSCFDQMTPGRRCLLGRAECSDRDPCPVHDRWKAAAEEVAAFFRETTLADVLEDASTLGAVPRRKARKKPKT
jgi:Rrf2 family protein